MTRLLSWIAIACIAAGSGVLGLWASERNPPQVVLSAKVAEVTVAPGGLMHVAFEGERYRPCAIKIDRILYDAQHVRSTLEDVEMASTGAPGRFAVVVPISVPRSFAEGTAIYHTIASYRCNLLHALFPIIEVLDVPFEIRGPNLPVVPPVEVEPANR